MAYKNQNELIWILECQDIELYTSLGFKKFMKTITDAEKDTKEIVTNTKLPFTSKEVLIFFDHVISEKMSENESINNSTKVITICKVADYLNYQVQEDKYDKWQNYDEFMRSRCQKYYSEIYGFFYYLFLVDDTPSNEWRSIQKFYEEYERIFGPYEIPKVGKREYKKIDYEKYTIEEGKHLDKIRKRLLELEADGIIKQNVTEDIIKRMLKGEFYFTEFFVDE